MHRLLILAVLLLPLAAGAQTTVYKTVDEHGNVSYSDTAPAGEEAETITLPKLNTTEPPPETPAAPAGPEAADEPEPVDYQVSIISPANDTTIPMGPGNFGVSASVKPPLAEGQKLQLYVDGKPWGDSQQNGSWALTNVFRGGHDVTAAVVDADGRRLAGSEAVRVYVLRPSINYPNRKSPQPRPRSGN